MAGKDSGPTGYTSFPSESKVNMRSSLLPSLGPSPTVFQGQLTLPKTPIEAYKLSKEVSHKALEMVGKSLCAQRPSNRAVFFLYGVSGAGKSSTLNHLFNGAESIPVSANKSGLRHVIEYVGSMVSDHWSADGLEISFVDAPGFNDTQGRVQDAYNLANIEQFISQHPQLGLHNFAKFAGIFYTYAVFYPNIVLITVDANDERMLGYDTDVGRMLRALGKKKMRIIDKKRPNVVFVMTHVCGIAKGHWETKLKSKAYCLQLLGRRYLKIHAPVVYIENDHAAWGLDKDGEWTILHNGERQPENLFNTCIEVMQKNQDEVGIEATRLYFEHSRLVPLHGSSCVKGNLLTDSDEVSLSENAQYWLRKIKSPFKILESTNVDLKINHYISEHKEDNLELDLYPLKFILQKNNLHEVEHIKSRTLPELENLLLPYRLSNLEKHVLCQLFDPKPPKLQQIPPVLGCGYNMLEDKILAPVFDTTQIEIPLQRNFYVPTGADEFEYPKIEAICCGLPDRAAYAEEKLKLFDSTDLLHVSKFPLSSGYNIIDPNSVPKKNCSVTFLIEQTVFRIQLRPTHPLCKKFRTDAGQLPDSFDNLDDESTMAFSNFFNKYGFWAIVQISLGGYIKGDIKTSRTNALKKDYYSLIRKWVITHIGNAMNGAKFSETTLEDNRIGDEFRVYQELLPSALQWFGGDERFHQSCLEKISMKSWNGWTESLKMNPAIIDGRHIPMPLHSILQSHDHSRAKVVQEAYNYLIGKAAALHKPSGIRRLLGMSTAIPAPRSRQEASDHVKTEINVDSCFPPTATVHLDSGQIIAMENVHIGDKVLSVNSEGRPCFSAVYLWGHLDPDAETEFLRIRHTQGDIRVSENHLVFVVGREEGGVGAAIPAGRVRAGDLLEYVSVDVVESVEVLSVSRVNEMGVYSPFTLTSRIVVDGVVCSVFAVPSGQAQEVTQVHQIGHALFAPIRLCYQSGVCPSLSYRMDAENRMHLFCSILQKGYSALRPIEDILFSKQAN